MKQFPPRWLENLLERLINPQLFNGIYGDLIEQYEQDLSEGNRFPQWRFVLAALGYLRYLNLLSMIRKENHAVIWASYLKASFRSLRKDLTHTSISLIGLTVSFLAATAIFRYTEFEYSYDQFEDHQSIYRVSHNFTNASASLEYAQTFFAANEDFSREIPEIETSTHFININGGILKRENQVFVEDQMVIATPEFFELFSLKLEGNAQDLSDPSSIILSEKMAIKYFGNEPAIGKTLEVQNVFNRNWPAKVVGVFEDVPSNSHLEIDVVLPTVKALEFVADGTAFGNVTMERIRWRWLGANTYLKLHPDASIEEVTVKANKIVERNRKEINEMLNQKHSIWLQPIREIHTFGGLQSEPSPTNDAQLLELLNITALVILFIAWINYINISTARAVTRAKEVGIRKILGSQKSQLRTQFLIEAFLLNFGALLAALLIIHPFYPYLETFVGVPFHGPGYSMTFFYYALAITLVGTLFSGWYPAMVLSNYQPIEVLKGKLRSSTKGIYLRRILVVIQLAFSLLLISSLLVIQGQMDFMVNHHLGMTIDQTLLLDSPSNQLDNDSYTTDMQTLQKELGKIPGVSEVAVSSLVPGVENFWRGSSEKRDHEEAGIFLHRATIDEHFLELYDIDLVAGRGFDPTFRNDDNSLIINQLAVDDLGFSSPEDALSESIYFAGNQEFKIVGVVSNFYQRGVQFAYEPYTFQLDTSLTGAYISVRFQTNELATLSREVRETYQSIFAGSPYNARYLDEVFKAQYDGEKQFRNVFTAFSSIALVVACLGLIGLSSYLINQRIKEVSIRKVMGAKNIDLFINLNREYMIIILIALIVTIPINIYMISYWLESYANRITLQPYFFLLPFVMILSIILIVTSGYTIKAIRANPATILREDG